MHNHPRNSDEARDFLGRVCKMKALFLGSIGVLVETSSIQMEAYNRAFRDQGLNFQWNTANYIENLKQPGGLRRLKKLFSQSIDETVLQKVHLQKQKIFEDLLATDIQLRNGIAELIAHCLGQNIKLGLITTATPQTVKHLKEVLAHAINFSNFDLITDKSSVKNEKPSSDIYNFALTKLGLLPSEVLAIEDTVANQGAASLAGIKCKLFPGDFATYSVDELVITSAMEYSS